MFSIFVNLQKGIEMKTVLKADILNFPNVSKHLRGIPKDKLLDMFIEQLVNDTFDSLGIRYGCKITIANQ